MVLRVVRVGHRVAVEGERGLKASGLRDVFGRSVEALDSYPERGLRRSLAFVAA